MQRHRYSKSCTQYSEALNPIQKTLMRVLFMLLMTLPFFIALYFLIVKVTIATSPHIAIRNGKVRFKNKVITNDLTKRLLHLHDTNEDVGPLTKFLENTQMNPALGVLDSFFIFLKRAGMPITQDGHFIAYKIVDAELLSSSIGKICENKAGSLDFYASPYFPEGIKSSERIQVLKINPKDVVFMPTSEKGNCSRCEVVGEYSMDSSNPSVNFKKKVTSDML